MGLNNFRKSVVLEVFAARVVILDSSLELDLTVSVDLGRRRVLLEVVLMVGSVPR